MADVTEMTGITNLEAEQAAAAERQARCQLEELRRSGDGEEGSEEGWGGELGEGSSGEGGEGAGLDSNEPSTGADED